MRDASILKLALAAGLLAAVLRMVLVQPETLGVDQAGELRRSAISGPLRDAAAAADRGDHAEAVRIAAEYLLESPEDQRGWIVVGASLSRLGAPDEALARWADLSPEALNTLQGGRGWAAYFLGYHELTERENQERALRAFAISADAFDLYLIDRAQRASATDRLYAARAHMRLGRSEQAARALRSLEEMIDFAPERRESSRVASLVRSAGRTWAAIGAPEEARALWSRWTDAMAAESPRSAGASSWLNYSASMHRAGEPMAALLALEQAERAAEAIGSIAGETPVDLWWRIGVERSRYEGPGAGDAALGRALEAQRLLAAELDTGEHWFRLARLAAVLRERDEALTALERAYDAGWRDPDRAMTLAEFSEIRRDPRFARVVDDAYRAIDERYAEQRESSRQRPRRGPRIN